MSDKSFGDHSNRNIVKNPLLSSAVTGLSLEDLTHKAVLLPVNPTLGQITRSDQEQGAQTRTLAHAGHESQVLPSGDALSNITLSPTTQITNPNILDSEYNVKLEKNCDTPNVTQSKALTKSDDDFDVNEYIARLQGSRYVSAPLHSHHKDDQNANLDATEENLEEINLNESQSPVEVQQSLTADIAQNFSQLPTVLPHVASAVFSSFSNMLSYKSREQTPDRHNVMPQHEQRSKGYDEVQFQRPDVGIPVMGMEEFSVPKEVAPPPKEPPIGGTSNFRITTKKKYAQIPGLSSGDATQSMTPPCQNIGFGHNMPPTSQIIPSISQMPPYGQNIPPPAQNAPAAQHMLHVEQPQNDLNMPPFSENVPPTSQNRPALAQNALPFNQNLPPYVQNAPPISQSISPIGVNVPSFLNPSGAQVGDSTKYKADDASSAIAKPQESIIQNAAASHLRYNILNPFNAESPSVTSEMSASESRANLFAVTKDTQHFFTPIEHKGQATQNIPSKPNVPGSASIIPPPPMFSNLPRRDSQSGVGKSVLPPSVARRISANQPIIKPAVSAPSFSENIFVPPSVSEASKEISSHVENIFSTGTLTSAFVPAHTTSIKLDPIGPSPSSIPPPSQINVPFRIPPVMPQASAPATFFIPSNDDKSQISTAFANPLPDSKFTPGPNMDLQTQSYVQPSILQPMLRNDQTPPALFNPLYAEPAPQNALNQITQMPPVTISEPPKPVVEPPKATANVNYRMIKKRPQYYAGPIEGVGPISNNVKPVIAPIIPSATHAEVSNFQGAFFIPDQPLQPATEQYGAPNIKQSSVPFDICAQGENVTSHVPFDISKPQEQAYGSPFDIRPPQTQTLGQDFNTAFDMSRATSDTYDPPKQESTGFGIIGSLKSKLSSIDINKIQNTVTTFFDPAYNEAKVEESATLENTSYGRQQKFGQSSQDQSSFDIYVPPVEHNQYSQFKHVGYDYSPKYNQTQEPVAANRDQNVYSTSSYFTDPNYSTEQVHTTNPLYDNTQAHLPAVIPDTQMSKSIDNAPFYDPSAFAQKSTANIINYKPSCKDQFKPDAITATLDLINPSSTINQSQQEFEQGKMHTSDTASVKAENATHSNPNAFSQASSQMLVNPQQYFDMYASSRPMVNLNKNKSSVSVPDEKEQPTFYNPNTFSFENQQTPTTQTSHALTSDNQQKTYPFSNDISSNASVTTNSDQIENLPICDSALNTSKYNMVNIQSKSHQNIPTRSPLVPASSFFDQTGSLPTFSKNDEIDFSMQSHALANDEIRYIAEQQEQFDSKNIEINKMLSETPVPISSKAANKYDQNKEGEEDCEKLSKENTSKESLSKGNLPILGVSTIPLFGLPALIGDRSREISEPANEAKRLPSTETSLKTRNLFEANTGINFFESIAPEQLPEKVLSIHENIAKGIPSDISGLSITDVKNVLLIEPPQENIGTVLKRNASSTKLETLLKSEEVSPEHYKRQNDSLPSTEFQEKLNLKFDETANEVFFKHLETTENELKSKKIPKDTSVKHQENENSPDLNICETCREVKTPDAGHDQNNKEIDDFTAQLIENITSNMSLSNPLTVPFSDGDAPIVDERSRFEDQQFEEITHIAEDTIETLQVQSAIDLLDDEITTSEVRNFGWTTEDAVYSAKAHVAHDYGFKLEPDDVVAKDKQYNFKMDPNTAVKPDDHDYEFKLDPNAIGFFGNNSLFFEQLPTNASDEIKAEIKHSHEEIVLPRQMSIPTAPPAEDDTKSDETGGLDVHSIEQDAKKDFPLEEEFIIEPSETDDDKIECRERKKSSDDSTLIDTFTNRVERFKKAADHDDSSEHKGAQGYGSPPISMASYFDTGNYAVESHYRNSLNSPTSINTFQFSTNTIRIPPGFEEEYARRLSGMSLSSGENRNEPCIPDTSTQTRTTSAITYCSSQETKDNVIGSEMRRKEHTEVGSENKSETNNLTITSESVQATSNFVTVDPVQSHSALFAPPVQPDVIPLNVQSLPDPINFFSANVEDAKPTEAAEESVNRLASYFSMPAAQPDHSKSFFELSQSQNHYRHKNKESDSKVEKPFFELSQGQNHYIDDATKHNITDLMKDLTSPRHLHEQIVRTVNYFTIELNNEIKHNTSAAPINVKILDENKIPIDSKTDSKTNVNNTILVGNDCKDIEPIIECKYCISNIPGINTNYLKVRTANDSTVTKTETEMTSEKENNKERRPTVNFGSFDAEGQTQDGIAVINEHRTSSEYTPVKYHWFYRVDVEDKSVWRGFSRTDSRSLEDAFHSPNLTESTLVATDGGRFDVNVLGRLRLAVYWKEKPTNVRRCSWFYKGTTDARYVPYTEAVAEKLEEEYRHGVTTGEWHRRLSLPNSEMVIMHGPSVMVHFLHSGATDAFSTPPQTTSRPRVVRRGHEESEIEDCEPSKIDHLLLLCHGVGSACDMRFRSVEEVVEDFRSTSLQLLESHYRNSFDNGIVSRVEVLPISWHAQLHSGETGVDRRLSRVTLDSIPRLRAFTNHTVLDVLFYTSPVFHQTIIDTVCSELNRIYSMFKQRNPSFKGEVSLGGHSLGSVILYDLLCHQMCELSQEPNQRSSAEKTYVPGTAASGQLSAKYPQLTFAPAALYALGSPIAIFECIRGVESLGMNFALPTCKNFFNIFHPYDPIAYRIEPLINPQLEEVKPSQIPHHKGRKRMHLELKDTMLRVGTDLKQKLIESLRTTWNKWKASPPIDGQLEKVVEEEIEKEQLCDDNKEEQTAEVELGPESLGRLNDGRRVDYVLQEAPLEMINEYLFAMTSHVGYWESEDTMLLMLREIYSSLGVQPDSTVPQQSMTVQRTRTLSQDEANVINEKEYPSTSRGST